MLKKLKMKYELLYYNVETSKTVKYVQSFHPMKDSKATKPQGFTEYERISKREHY